MVTDDGEFMVKKWKHCIYCGWDGQTKKNFCQEDVEFSEDEQGTIYMKCGQPLHDNLDKKDCVQCERVAR